MAQTRRCGNSSGGKSSNSKPRAPLISSPDSLDHAVLPSALWIVIEALGRLRVYLDQTDHLSDRELYTHPWGVVLPEEMPALDDDPGSAWHVDILGGCSNEDIALYLTHYADEPTRTLWLADCPEYQLADHVDPPYDRDRHLPPYQDRTS
jgi:hypothetical protein